MQTLCIHLFIYLPLPCSAGSLLIVDYLSPSAYFLETTPWLDNINLVVVHESRFAGRCTPAASRHTLALAVEGAFRLGEGHASRPPSR